MPHKAARSRLTQQYGPRSLFALDRGPYQTRRLLTLAQEAGPIRSLLPSPTDKEVGA